MKSINFIIIICIFLFLSSCRNTYIPYDLSDKSETVMYSGYGAMADIGYLGPNIIKTYTDNDVQYVIGELLATDDSCLYILQYDYHEYLDKNNKKDFVVYSTTVTQKDDTMRIFKIPTKRLVKIQYVKYKFNSQEKVAFPLTTTLWSLTHGLMLIFTLPFNLIMDIIIWVSESQTNIVNLESYKEGQWKLNSFCRYPQGIQEIDIQKIRPKKLFMD